MGDMLAQDVVTFSQEDLREMEMEHNNALFITIRCRDKIGLESTYWWRI